MASTSSILFAALWIAIPIVRSVISREMRFRWRTARADSRFALKTEPIFNRPLRFWPWEIPVPSDPLRGKRIAKRFYADFAWEESALRDIPTDGTVLLIGSGLTAIDQVLGLKAQGFRGTIAMVSRRGKLPAVHCSPVPWNVDWADWLPTTVSSATREVRRQIDLASQCDVDWRSVIDSLRPWTSTIWKQWPLQERQRFLRHMRPFWEASRHRLPPATHQAIEELIACGSLRVLAGRVTEAIQQDTKVDVSILLRGTRETVSFPLIALSTALAPERVIECRSHSSRGFLKWASLATTP